MTRLEKFKNMSAADLAKYICDKLPCEACPLSKFDDLFYEVYCPIEEGKETKTLIEWLEGEVSDND